VMSDWRAAVSAGTPFSKEYRHRFLDGTVNWVRMVGTPVREGTGPVNGYVGAIVDVTEPHALQLQLALASRLAAMGTMVTGVAHEINNPLAAELADQGLALEVVREVRDRIAADASPERQADVRQLDGVLEALGDAQGSGQRIAGIVRDLTTFGRPDPRRTRAHVIDIVKGALRWLPAAVARTHAVEVEDGGAPDVMVSGAQVEQVLLNLLTNAAWAMPEGQHAPIIVRLLPGKAGMARIDVIDHGKGIEPSALERIFEPFFTTHPTGVGRGTGLGLAIGHAIVTGHGGTLTVESELGKGSTFHVELPAAPAVA
jgi:two-component system NtrC family sensor kinase